MSYDEYKPSTLDLNSPEINRLAYGPVMNAHVERLKKHRASKGASFKEDAQREFTEHVNYKFKAPVTRHGNVSIIRIKPKFCCICKVRVYTYSIKEDGKVYGECHKDAYKPERSSKSGMLIKVH